MAKIANMFSTVEKMKKAGFTPVCNPGQRSLKVSKCETCGLIKQAEFERADKHVAVCAACGQTTLLGGKPQCQATTKSGKPCQNTAMPESNYCGAHQHH